MVRRFLLLVILLLILAGCTAVEVPTFTPTPAPTADPEIIPTSTPVPTPMPELAATLTPEPTPTVFTYIQPSPTFTPGPTPTTFNTTYVQPTPIPTLTAMERNQLALARTQCDDSWFQEEIIDLSQERQSAFASEILKLYLGATEIERTDRILRCMGTARLSRAGDVNLTYYYEIDRDGDAFIGYQIGEAVATSTPVPTPTAIRTPTPTPTPIPGTSRSNPLPLGMTGVMYHPDDPEDHWAITVLEVTPDAIDAIMTKKPVQRPA